MRIGIVGPTGTDEFATNIAESLPTLGAEAVLLGPATPRPAARPMRLASEVIRRQSAATETWLQKRLVRQVRHEHLDAVLSVQNSLMPTVVQSFHDTGAKVVLWYQDAISNMGRQAMLAAPYDALFVKDALLAQRLTNVYGLPATYLPEACNPRIHRPIGHPGSKPYIAVVGSIYPSRARLLERLHHARVPLHLFGPGAPSWYDGRALKDLPSSPYVTGPAKSRVFREARGVLNNLHPAEMTSVNCRLFEAAGAGAAVLCEARATLPDLFVPQLEVLSFNTFDELVTQCRQLLDDPTLQVTLGTAANRRAYRDHTYAHRLQEILSVLEQL